MARVIEGRRVLVGAGKVVGVGKQGTCVRKEWLCNVLCWLVKGFEQMEQCRRVRR